MRWGPCHTEVFWRENVYRFEEKDFGLINQLFDLVKDSRDPLTISVALFDLGEFARYYPNSKILFDRNQSTYLYLY